MNPSNVPAQRERIDSEEECLKSATSTAFGPNIYWE